MAKRGVSVGVEITGSAKGFKAASEDAARATSKLDREARDKAKKIEQSFKMTTIAIAKIGAAIAVAGVAFEVFKKVMDSTEGTSDKFRESTDYAKGAVKGLFQTMASGEWESFLTNIKLTAEATRDFGKAIDELEDRIAGDKIQLGQWERKLQSARLVYSEFKDTDPSRAKEAVNEAIYYQKAITALTVQELKERSKITEDYYRKKTPEFDKSQFDYIIKQFPLIAKSQRMLLDPSYMKGLEKLNTVASKNMLAAIKNFIYFRDTLSQPGQFNEFIEGLGQIEEAAARGDEELIRLTKQLATLNKQESNAITRITGPVNISGLSAPKVSQGFAAAPGLAGAPVSPIKEMTDGLDAQMNMVNNLNGSLTDMFMNADKGFKSMADSLIQSIKRIAAELAAKAALFGILKVLFPGLFINMDLYKSGAFGNFVTGGLLGGKSIAMGPQNINIGGKFQLKGADAYAMVGRYGNVLNGST